MRLPAWKTLLTGALLALPTGSGAMRMLQSTSLNQCDGSTTSGFTATLFNVVFTPDNGTLSYNINAISSISQKVVAQLNVIAYGLVAINKTIDPCNEADFSTLCPLNPGSIPINSNSQLPPSAVNQIPGLAFTVPDLDARVRVYLLDRTTHQQVACVEAELTNGQTVDQLAVAWVVAIIAGLGLVASAVTSGLGHSNTAAHVAANAVSLFGFFQAQAIVGMSAVEMPPIVQSWTQNFQWSMGIIRIGFMQTICTWYQRATGGTPSSLLSNLSVQSVAVQKRSLEVVDRLMKRGYSDIVRRQSNPNSPSPGGGNTQVVVKGIERVGFRSGIEPTNIFITGLGFFIAFIVGVSLCVALFKGGCELAAKRGWMKGHKFQEFRSGWRVVLKGILFRIILIGYSQMCILCLWELTVRDSAAEVVLALFYFVAMTAALFWAAFKVLRLAKRSVALHKSPGYILYSDPTALNKWGFLYVQYRASAYYWIFPLLLYILLKAVFIAFAQGAGVAQAIGLLVIEAAWLIGVSILRPWMDKKTNSFNIAIAAINFLNAIFLLIFSNIFNQPGLVSGIVGVAFALINAVFALVLLLMVLIASGYAIFSKNPDTRYQPMRDDRGSFIKSQSNLNTELDALGATARGDMRMKRDLDDDSDSLSSHHRAQQQLLQQHPQQGAGVPPNASQVPLPASAATSTRNLDEFGAAPPSPANPNAPFLNKGAPAQHGGFNGGGGGYSGHGSPYGRGSPAPRPPYSAGGGYGGYERSGSLQSSNNGGYRPHTSGSQGHGGYRGNGGGGGGGGNMWQRGAGYDH